MAIRLAQLGPLKFGQDGSIRGDAVTGYPHKRLASPPVKILLAEVSVLTQDKGRLIDGGAANGPGRTTGDRMSGELRRFLRNIDRAVVNKLRHIPSDLPQDVRDVAWQAQLRLGARYRNLIAKRKKSQVAVTIPVMDDPIGFF